MDGERFDVRFSGDLGDPWVRAIRAAMPSGTVAAEGPELPEDWTGDDRPGVLVLHRATLGAGEADRLRALRRGGTPTRVVLVVGPHARYHQVMAWSGLVDVVLPEATARETIGRHLRADPAAPTRRPSSVPGRRPRVAVASGQHDLAAMIEEALRLAGYEPRRCRDEPADGDEPWVVWDVPVLEPGWTHRLAGAAQRRGVVVLLGLADRETVAAARGSGAVACLDLPCDPDDLVHVLDRLTARPSAVAGTSRPRRTRPRSLSRE